jgi:PIN domain nuclease of toxin-antitoxin system
VKALLDTHVLIWWLEGRGRLSRKQQRVVARATAGDAVGVSDITLWEVALAYELGRVKLRMPLLQWLEAAVSPPAIERVGISPAVAAEVATFPATFHRDPADRILVATARVLALPLVTSDQRIVDSGLCETIT